MRGPLPQVRLMPTGGVTRENAGDWIRAGAVAIGVGTALVDRRAVAERRFDVLTAHARHFVEAVQAARGASRPGHGDDEDVCFGEIMLRLSPPGFERLFQSPALQATFGGGEANVAVSLAHFGATALRHAAPGESVGDAALRALRAEGVDVEHVVAAVRASASTSRKRRQPACSAVVYDRAHSAISEIAAGQRPLARRLRRRRLVSLHRHHAGAEPFGRCCTREASQAARQAGARSASI